MELIFYLAVTAAAGEILYRGYRRIEERCASRSDLMYRLLHGLVAALLLLPPAICLLLVRLAGLIMEKGEGYLAYLRYAADILLYRDMLHRAGQMAVILLIVVWLTGAGQTFGRLGSWGQGINWGDGRMEDRMQDQMQQKAQRLVQDIAQDMAGEMGIRAQVSVRLMRGISSPELRGIFRPIVCLPEDCLPETGLAEKERGEERLRCVLAHELTHYKSRDRWFRWLCLLYVCLYWFVPVSRRLFGELEKWDEYHCDREVCESGLVTKAAYVCTLCQMALERQQRRESAQVCLGRDRFGIVARLNYLEKTEGAAERLTWEPEILIREGITILLQMGAAAAAAGIASKLFLALL